MSDASLTLRAYFEGVYSDTFLLDADPRTVREIDTSVRYFEWIIGSKPLAAITREDLLRFRNTLLTKGPGRQARSAQKCFPFLRDARWYRGGGPLQPATVNHRLRELRALLNRAGPPVKGNPHGLGLLDTVPSVPALREARRPPRDVSDEILSQIWLGCERSTYPELLGVTPADWWRALIITALVSGYRREALLGITWDHVDVFRRVIRVPPHLDKEDTAREKRVLPQVIERLQRIHTAMMRVFPWPHSQSTWYRQWRAIQRGRVAEPIKFHDLKRACGSRFAEVSESPHVVQRRLDHASINTSVHYVNAAAAEERALAQFRLPPAFAG